MLKGVNKTQTQWSQEPAFVGQSYLRALEISEHVGEKTKQVIPCHNQFDVDKDLKMLLLETPKMSVISNTRQDYTGNQSLKQKLQSMNIVDRDPGTPKPLNT